jgi:hypothetical protein
VPDERDEDRRDDPRDPACPRQVGPAETVFSDEEGEKQPSPAEEDRGSDPEEVQQRHRRFLQSSTGDANRTTRRHLILIGLR